MSYFDKINPNFPEGRLLLVPEGYALKDPCSKQSPVPLEEKWSRYYEILKKMGYSAEIRRRYLVVYKIISEYHAARDIDQYNTLMKRYNYPRSIFMDIILYDFYDMEPTNRKISKSSYYKLNDSFRQLIDDCLIAAKNAQLKGLTASIEASATASFFEYLQENCRLENIFQIEEKHIQGYRFYRHCTVTHLYRIGLFLQRGAGYWKCDELLKLTDIFPKQLPEPKVYPALSKTERECLEKFLLDPESNISPYSRCAGIILLYTGMRAQDVQNLKLSDIDWHNNRINYHQDKTDSENFFPLLPVIGNAIMDFIQNSRPHAESDYLFVRPKNEKGYEVRPSIAILINDLYAKAGIRQNKGVRKGTHLLRHSMADEMINNENELSVVSKTLGHKHFNTTLVYLTANVEQLRKCALDVSAYPIESKFYTKL